MYGDDFVYGGTGNDQTLRGDHLGSGDDAILLGRSGRDLLLGDCGDNALRGRGGDNQIQGDLGDDSLDGGIGDDFLEGGSGSDSLLMNSGDEAFGGSGADSFLFDGTPLGNAGSGGPVIRDFDGVSVGGADGEDKLVFATGLEVGAFAYIGPQAFSGGGNSDARYAGPRQVQVDRDGDGQADQAFLLDGVTAANLLTTSDFLSL